MSKHSKGKHIASKKPFEWKGKRSSSIRHGDDETTSLTEEGSEAFASPEAHDLGVDESVGLHPASASPLSTAAGESSPFSSETDAQESAEKASCSEEVDEAAVTQAFAPVSADSSDASAPNSEEAAKSASVAAASAASAPVAPVISIKPERDRKKIAKRAGITFAVVVGTIALLYFAGVLAFHALLMPNSKLSSIDMSFKTKDQVSAELNDAIGKYNFKVKGHGMNVSITSAEAGIALDADEVAQAIIDSQDPWRWPLSLFSERDVSQAVADAMSATGLADVIQAEVDRVNATAYPPVDATVAYVEDAKAFEVIPEVPGTMLDVEKVLEATVAGTLVLDDNIILTRDALVQPQVFEDDKRLSQAALEANRLVKANVTLNLSGTDIAVVDASVIWPWVEISPDFAVVFNADKMNEWAADIASKCNTVGSTRTYTRPDGKVITVSGGSYGWRINSESLIQSITDAINTGTIGVIDIPVEQAGSGFVSLGGQDWGKRYVDVDLSEQYARFYDDTGAIIWESAIVSGLPREGRATPKGVYFLNQKASPSTLIGYKPDGTKDYESKVQYWMPFKGNSVGLHDADWQSSFGGRRYLSSGSHGCVNLPPSKAKELYGLIKVGDVVVVHS